MREGKKGALYLMRGYGKSNAQRSRQFWCPYCKHNQSQQCDTCDVDCVIMTKVKPLKPNNFVSVGYPASKLIIAAENQKRLSANISQGRAVGSSSGS